MRRFKADWKDAATGVINGSLGEFRYVIAKYATKDELAQAAMQHYRREISAAHNQYVNHPKSRKAIETIRQNSRTLASIGLYCLEHNLISDTTLNEIELDSEIDLRLKSPSLLIARRSSPPRIQTQLYCSQRCKNREAQRRLAKRQQTPEGVTA
jgi:hypothetical protein